MPDNIIQTYVRHEINTMKCLHCVEWNTSLENIALALIDGVIRHEIDTMKYIHCYKIYLTSASRFALKNLHTIRHYKAFRN